MDHCMFWHSMAAGQGTSWDTDVGQKVVARRVCMKGNIQQSRVLAVDRALGRRKDPGEWDGWRMRE